MAKMQFLDWDVVPSGNTDLGGIGILGSNAVRNFDDALRTLMAQLRRDIDNGVVYAAKTLNYTAVANDNNAVHRFTATATLALTAAVTLGADWHYTIIADGGDVTVDPNGSETINGSTTLVVQDGSMAFLICSGTAFYAYLTPGQNTAKWRSRFIGEIVYANTALTGAEKPPSTITDTVWIELTSGLTGSGAFNEAKLTSENVSGSAPLVLASAVINYSASPLNGQTIRLLNTESRWLRPSLSPNTLQNDAFQNYTGLFQTRVLSGGQSVFTGFSGAFTLNTNSGSSASRIAAGLDVPLSTDSMSFDPSTASGARTAAETRVKNVGVKAYMRIA